MVKISCVCHLPIFCHFPLFSRPWGFTTFLFLILSYHRTWLIRKLSTIVSLSLFLSLSYFLPLSCFFPFSCFWSVFYSFTSFLFSATLICCAKLLVLNKVNKKRLLRIINWLIYDKYLCLRLELILLFYFFEFVVH